MYDEDYVEYREPKSPVPAAFITALLTTLGLFFGLRYLEDRGILGGGGGDKPAEAATIEVPSVVGLVADQARELLRGRGLMLSIGAEREDPKFAAGTIASQAPLPGSQASRGAAVQVVVSRGAGQVVVPALAGLKPDEAARQIAARGLQLGAQRVTPSDTVVAGAVVQTEPAGGTTVAPEAQVVLVVSSGAVGAPAGAAAAASAPAAAAGSKRVPKVTGTKLVKAKALLERAGFKPGKIRYIYDERYGELVILKQSPPENAVAATGAGVDLVVNEPN